MNRIRILALAAVLTAAATTTSMAAALQWGAGGSSPNWSDGNNWNSFPTAPYGVPPGPSDAIYFEDALYSTGYTNVPGAVNNILDTTSSIGAANYSAMTNHFYTTLIPGGVSLTLGDSGSGAAAALAAGDIPGTGQWVTTVTGTNYSTITGAGTLNVTNGSTLISVGWQGRATLDLAGLNQFNANVGHVLIGASSDNPYGLGPTGWLLLAETNNITTAPNLSGPGVLLGYATNGSALGFGVVALGAFNAFNTDGLTVGGRRANQLTALSFGAAYLNATPLATFTLRGSAGGATPIETFSMGDLSANCDGYGTTFPGTSSASTGKADFSGGAVDILADTIIIGRSASAPGTQSGTGVGNLFVEHGTVTATNVFVGQKLGTNNSSALGILTLKGDSVMNVVSNFALGFRTNLNFSTGTATATLNVNDSAVLNVGGNFITGFTNNGSTRQTINIGSGQINVAGLITNNPGSLWPNLTNVGGALTANGTMNLNTLNGFGTLSNISTTTVSNGMALGLNGPANTGASRVPGTLVVGGNLNLSNNFTLKFKLGTALAPGDSANDYLVVSNNLSVTSNKIDLQFVGQPTVGSYDLIYYGGTQLGWFTNIYTNTTRNYTFTLDQTVPNHVKLNVAGGPPATLTWSGGVNGLWDLTNNVNWNNNTSQFYSYDRVVFDDTGSQQVIGIPNTVVQGGITFNNNTKTYTLWDNPDNNFRGKISGFGGITKNGTGTVILDMNNSANDFVGPININNGIIQDQSVSAGTAGTSGQLFGATNNVITITDGASLDLYGNNVGANIGANGVFFGIGYPIVFSGNGHGGIGALVNNAMALSGSNSTLYTPSATMAGDASVGAATAGLNLTVRGVSLRAPFNLAGYTLSTIGAGNIILNSFIATNSGNIQVDGPSLSLVDVQLGGAGTLNVGSRILGLGTLNGAGWTSTYGVSKAISIGGTIVAAASGGVTIPVSSLVTLTGNTTITNNQAINLSGIVSGGYGITKQGTASLRIDGADTYTGSTIVNSGNLVLGSAGSLASSPLVRIDAGAGMDVTAQPGSYTIPAGQTVQVDGTAAGNFTVPSGAAISGAGTYLSSVSVNGGALVPGTLDLPRTVAFGSLNLNNASLTYELDASTMAGANVNDLVAARTLSISGVNIIKIVPVGSLDTTGGQYTLFTYSGATLPSSITNNLVLTSDTGYTFAFVDPATTPGSIQIIVSGAGGQSKVWQGGVAAAPTAWDINTTSNWLAGVSQVTFLNRDSVQFDDTGLTNVVDLVSSVRPSTVTFANNTQAYTLQGPGSLRADALTNSGTAGVIIANAADNTLTGAGLLLNNSPVIFNQPTNASFTASLNSTGSGGLDKEGTNRLTLVGISGGSFNGPIAVNEGTLQAGASNTFGAGTVTVTNSATVDLNGQVLVASTFALSGSGVSGQGAVNNTGGQQTNAVQNVILQGDTTIGASSRWDLSPDGPSSFQGNSFNLTKVGAGAIFLGPKQDTSVSNINITAGELAFAWQGTDLGSAGSIVVQSNAMLTFAYDIAAGTKPTTVMPGGQIGAEFLNSFGKNNSYAGDITFVGTGVVNIASKSAGLILSGGLHGPSGLVNAGRGSLTLAGSNDYSGDLTFNLGSGFIANDNAIPANSSVTLNSLGAPGLDNVGLTLMNDVATPANAPLNMISYVRPSGANFPSFSGNGTWNGPINAIAVITDNSLVSAVNFNGGSNRLALNGTITQTGARQMSLNLNGAMPGTIALNQPLVWSGKITLADSYFSFTNGNPATAINTLELNATGNSFTNFFLSRGKLRIGADNAYPRGCPLDSPGSPGTPGVSYADDREIIDLNGHFQTISNITLGDFAGTGLHWIGNDSATADATLIFDSSGRLTNSFGGWICDNLDPDIPTPHRTALTVSSGGFHLVYNLNGPRILTNVNESASGPTNNAYSGPTLVQGGIFQCDAPVPNSPVTVSGTGTLRGTGPFYQPMNINLGGTLSPGGGGNFNTLTFQVGPWMTNYSALALGAGSTTLMKLKTSPMTNDSVQFLNTVTYGGTLVVTNLGGSYTNGQAFKFFNATNYVGNYASIMPLVPAPGLIWSNTLPLDGTLRVTTVSTVPPALATTVSGGNMTISWPPDHAGWRLQVQTNNIGLGTNWFTVSNSTNVLSVIVPLVRANPCVFYRLVYP